MADNYIENAAVKAGVTKKRMAGKAIRSKHLLSCRLALRELEAAARLGPAVLLTLDYARVAGQEAAALERAAQIGLVGNQRLGEAVTDRARLPRQPATRHGADNVVLAVAVGRDQRLLDQHPQHRTGEIHLECAGVDL